MRPAPRVSFFRADCGHGLAEYCLITAFIALVALGLYIHLSGGMQDLWSTANSTLVTGSSTTGSGGATAATGSH